MAALGPLAIVVPVLTAAVLVGLGRRLPTVVADGIALAAALATTVLCAILLGHVWHGTQVAWMAGWHPRAGDVAIGIDLAVDPLGAGAATFAAGLLSAGLIYSQRYFEEIAPLYQALMLVLLAGIVGVCFTGDLFNLFVFFELMSVPAYALTAYDVEEGGPIQGGLAFAVTNSLGSFFMLTGVGLLYARSGGLNLAQIGEALAGHRPDGLVIAAFALIASAFLIKAAIVPFHFWLPDAYAVAPVPVCVLFAGIMVELGLFGLARVYWTAFSGVPGLDGHALGDVLAVLGAATALVGAAMALGQHHLKRLLAFSTVSHAGLLLIGLATLDDHGLGGVMLFGLAHGALDASLFMAAGIVGRRRGTVAERELHGQGRGLPLAGAVFLVGGAALASLPPFGPFMGKSLVEEAASAHGRPWAPALFAVCTAALGAAVLRFAARAFLGLGEPAPTGDPGTEREADEEHSGADWGRTPLRMALPTVALLVIALGVGTVPAMRHGIDHAAAIFTDRPAYAAQVLHARPAEPPRAAPATGPHTSSLIYALASVAGALVGAAAALTGLRRHVPTAARRPVALLHAWHDGHVGDYATWTAVGVALLSWTLAVTVR